MFMYLPVSQSASQPGLPMSLIAHYSIGLVLVMVLVLLQQDLEWMNMDIIIMVRRSIVDGRPEEVRLPIIYS